MGLCQSEEEKIKLKKNQQIDKQLRLAHNKDEKILKLLLLGKIIYILINF